MKRTPLKRQSTKRRSEQAARTAVREATLARAGYRCEADLIVPEVACGGPLDVDERKSRGVNPGGHLDDTNTQALCRNHHRWRTDNPQEAWERGLRVKSWENDSRTLDDPGARIPVLDDIQGHKPVQPAWQHPIRAGTVDWMCQGIMIRDHWVHSAAELINEVGLDIPADLLAAACTPHTWIPAEDGSGRLLDTGPSTTEEPFEPTDCFCCVDANMILDGLGLTYTEDDIGDLVVTD